MVEIVQDGHKALRKIADEVTEKEFGSTKLLKILSDMKEALDSQDDGVALAAPQIAITKRIFVVSSKILKNEEVEKDFPLIYINPIITKISSDKKKMDEGCLSVRPLYGIVKRSTRATVEAFDENGEGFSISASGLIAQIFQHEIDHLDGILFIDKAKHIKELNINNE
ncbi:MAG: peptide deformylase [Candidatus Pacebacteria bacterium]|nr:peptide deformylase [Candidatus Paceibacterota bacterium]